jgi:hypothetical protein
MVGPYGANFTYVPLNTALSVIPLLKAFAFRVVVLVKVSGLL